MWDWLLARGRLQPCRAPYTAYYMPVRFPSLGLCWSQCYRSSKSVQTWSIRLKYCVWRSIQRAYKTSFHGILLKSSICNNGFPFSYIQYICVFKNPTLSLVSFSLSTTSTFPFPQKNALLLSWVSYTVVHKVRSLESLFIQLSLYVPPFPPTCSYVQTSSNLVDKFPGRCFCPYT